MTLSYVETSFSCSFKLWDCLKTVAMVTKVNKRPETVVFILLCLAMTVYWFRTTFIEHVLNISFNVDCRPEYVTIWNKCAWANWRTQIKLLQGAVSSETTLFGHSKDTRLFFYRMNTSLYSFLCLWFWGLFSAYFAKIEPAGKCDCWIPSGERKPARLLL